MKKDEIKTPWNPSKKATDRVKDKLPTITECHYCNGEVGIVNNTFIYGSPYGEWPWAYRCVDCQAYVGLHPFTNIPLGTLANRETREARKHSKNWFLKVVSKKKLERKESYQWLANLLEIDKSICHFGMFDIEMCNKVRKLCMEILGKSRK